LASSLHNTIDSAYRLVTSKQVRVEAIKYWNQLHPHPHRSTKPFNASDGWIQRFKRRHNFCRGKPKMVRKIPQSKKQDYEEMKYHFICYVEEAINKYGPDLVLNMDETPCKTVECPTQAWGSKAKGKKLYVSNRN
jgi:hypothetical protein